MEGSATLEANGGGGAASAGGVGMAEAFSCAESARTQSNPAARIPKSAAFNTSPNNVLAIQAWFFQKLRAARKSQTSALQSNCRSQSAISQRFKLNTYPTENALEGPFARTDLLFGTRGLWLTLYIINCKQPEAILAHPKNRSLAFRRRLMPCRNCMDDGEPKWPLCLLI